MADGVGSLLLDGAQALCVDGSLSAGRRAFDAAYRLAERAGDGAGMVSAALGLSGLWLHEQRSTPGSTIVRIRLRDALSTVDPHSSYGMRLRARLAADADYRSGGHAGILGVLAEARRSGDPVARAEAACLAHSCLLGPDHGTLRHALTQELLEAAARTGRRCDLLMGVLWRTVDLLLDGDPHAGRSMAELRGLLSAQEHLAIGFVVRATEVMYDIREGRFARAEAAARECRDAGVTTGDADAGGWHLTHLAAIRWHQGRIAELAPALREMANSPTLTAVDNSQLAALALAAAAAGENREAAGALARLGHRDLAALPRSSTWLVTIHHVVETAYLLDDRQASAAAYELLSSFPHLPVIAGPGVACFGSVQGSLGVAALATGQVDRAVKHLREGIRDNLALGHWPATTLCRWRLAAALTLRGHAGDSAEAARARDIAAGEAAELGMALPQPAAGSASRPDGPARGPQGQPVSSRRVGRHWEITMGDRRVRVRDSRGILYLAMLCASPGREIRAAELAAGPALVNAAGVESANRSTQPLLDDAARRDYQRRLSILQRQIDEYTARGDTDRTASAAAERDWLLAELTAATGLVGRAREFSNAEERARISVGKAIRRTIAHIEEVDEVLGRQLRDCVHTGLRCCYWPA